MDRHGFLGRLPPILSVIVAFTSLLDLFVNRLLFRAGPEVLTHMEIPGLTELAVIGRISFTFEQIALYLILGSAAMLLASEGEVLHRYLGVLIIPQLVCAALLYFSIPLGLAWGVSMLLVLVTAVEVVGLLWIRALGKESLTGKQRAVQRAFLSALALCFIFPIYYRISVARCHQCNRTAFRGWRLRCGCFHDHGGCDGGVRLCGGRAESWFQDESLELWEGSRSSHTSGRPDSVWVDGELLDGSDLLPRHSHEHRHHTLV